VFNSTTKLIGLADNWKETKALRVFK